MSTERRVYVVVLSEDDCARYMRHEGEESIGYVHVSRQIRSQIANQQGVPL